MKKDFKWRSYNNPNKTGNWATWTEICDKCGATIKEVDKSMCLSSKAGVEKELAEKEDLCLACFNKRLRSSNHLFNKPIFFRFSIVIST